MQIPAAWQLVNIILMIHFNLNLTINNKIPSKFNETKLAQAKMVFFFCLFNSIPAWSNYQMAKKRSLKLMKLYAFSSSFDNLQIFVNDNSFVLKIQFQENNTRNIFTWDMIFLHTHAHRSWWTFLFLHSDRITRFHMEATFPATRSFFVHRIQQRYSPYKLAGIIVHDHFATKKGTLETNVQLTGSVI